MNRTDSGVVAFFSIEFMATNRESHIFLLSEKTISTIALLLRVDTAIEKAVYATTSPLKYTDEWVFNPEKSEALSE